jgi:hypothetical protein
VFCLFLLTIEYTKKIIRRLRRFSQSALADEKFVDGWQLKQKHRQFDLLSANTDAAVGENPFGKRRLLFNFLPPQKKQPKNSAIKR